MITDRTDTLFLADRENNRTLHVSSKGAIFSRVSLSPSLFSLSLHFSHSFAHQAMSLETGPARILVSSGRSMASAPPDHWIWCSWLWPIRTRRILPRGSLTSSCTFLTGDRSQKTARGRARSSRRSRLTRSSAWCDFRAIFGPFPRVSFPVHFVAHFVAHFR